MATVPQNMIADEWLDRRRLALAAVYGFGFFAPWSISAGQLFQILLLLVLITAVVSHGRWARREPLIWITVAFCTYVLVRGGIAVLERPDLASAHWDGATQWMKSGPLAVLVVAAGFGVAGDWRRHVPRVFALWILGLGINVLRHMSPSPILAALEGNGRYGFGMQYIEAGVLHMAAILVVVAFAPVIIVNMKTRRASVLVGIVALVVFLLLAGILVATGTRTTWIAGAVALVLMAVLGAVIGWRNRSIGLRRPAAMLSTVLALALVLGFAFGDRVAQRMAPELDKFATVPAAVLAGDIESIEDDAFNRRWALWEVAARAFVDRPLFGHGPADVRYLLREYPRPPEIENFYTHLHNGYSMVFNRFGLVGGLPIVLLFVLVFRESARLMRTGDGHAGALGVLVVGFTVSMLIVALAEQRFNDYHIVEVYSIIAGAALAPGLMARLREWGNPSAPGTLG